MSVDPEEIIRRTQEMLLQSQQEHAAPASVPTSPLPASVPVELESLQAELPPLEEGQFLIDASTRESRAIFCVRELTWHEAQEIELRAFRLNERNDPQFAGEYERRETLKKAIAWGCVISTPLNIQHNDAHGTLLKKVHASAIDSLWQQYQARVTLGSDEASALYRVSQAYFRGEAQVGVPVPPLVIEVDFWMKGVQWTREDFRRVSVSDFERIQLILAARSDALGVSAPKASGAIQSASHSEVLSPELIATFPPHIRQRLGK
jgi:hypothetical protein